MANIVIRWKILYLICPKVKKYAQDLVYVKNDCNRYGIVASFLSNFLTEVTDTDEMYKMLNDFNNEINELKGDYLAGREKEIDDILENILLVYSNQLKLFNDYIIINKHRTPTKRIYSEKLFKHTFKSLKLSKSIQFPSFETIVEREKLKPW